MHSTSFKDMFLKEELLRAIKDCGFEHPSEVQQECLPKALIGLDVLTQAKSGMGKTAIFVLSILNRMDAKPDPLTALIIAHTRELAYQIKNEFVRFSKYMPDIKTEVIYGGESVPEQEKMLKNNPPHILVGTPGRLLNLIRRKSLKMDKIKYFILDECDKGLEQLGNIWLFMLRYEGRHSEDILRYTKREASDDVLSHTPKRHTPCLPQIHAPSKPFWKETYRSLLK